MKTLFTVLFLISVLIYSAKTTVTLKPFSISFEQPIIPFAILTLCLAIFLFQYDAVEKTKKELIDKYYEEGLNDGFDTAVKMLEKELNNKK